jgi:hypothetical protein
MKKRTIFIYRAIIALLMLSFVNEAQVMTLNNSLNCNVTVGYELRDAGCGVCASGSIIVPPGGTTFPLCPGAIDICIFVIDIEGCIVANNHQTYNNGCCTIFTPANGTTCAAAPGCSSVPWNALLLAGWQFNIF